MQLVYLIYDSIQNSVFDSQVWQPLVQRVKQNQNLQVTLISFETQAVTLKYSHPQIKTILLFRTRFWGKLNLIALAYKIRKLLPSRQPYLLMARGPFAGYIAKHAQTRMCEQIIIQARGLAHAEYAYANLQPNWPQRALIWLRIKQLNQLERKAYQTKQANIQIECVSPALQDYLIQNYATKLAQTTIAKLDLPAKFAPAQCLAWRTNLRQQLSIPDAATVYCYSGSAHLWQCPNLIIEFFKIKLTQDPQAFLLILSSQPDIFIKLLKLSQINPANYYVTGVHPQEIYQYLAIADFGLILREPHLLNWVSRPTKALEYAAVGLTVLHNNTVSWLMETFPQS